MTYQGTIKNGVVVLEQGVSLPEGTSVRIEPIEEGNGEAVSPEMLLAEALQIANTMKGLPSDLARNHDHYLHGRPKK